MVRIVVCEDNKTYMNGVVELISSIMNEARITVELIGLTDVKQIKDNDWSKTDIVLLDVVMNEIDGMQLGKTIRDINSKAIIIFMSAYVQFAPYGYDVGARGYILKDNPFFSQVLREKIMDAISELSQNDKSIKTYFEGKDVQIRIKDILLLEGRGTISVAVLKSGEEMPIWKRLGAVQDELADTIFLRISKKCIVNVMYADRVSSYKLYLSNGDTLKVSRKHYSDIVSRFLLMKGRLS